MSATTFIDADRLIDDLRRATFVLQAYADGILKKDACDVTEQDVDHLSRIKGHVEAAVAEISGIPEIKPLLLA